MPTFRKDIKTGTKVPLIKTDDLNDKLITTDKLADGSVTNPKLAPESVTQDKFDKQLLEIFQAAAGLPKDLIKTIQDVDDTLKDHQAQISSNDDDISELLSQTKQIKDTVDGIAVSGGASIASAVSYDNSTSGLEAMNTQNAIDELSSENKKQDEVINTKADLLQVSDELAKKFDKKNIAQELGESEDKVVSQSALPFRVEESEEWAYLIKDAEDHILLGIQQDGSVEWSAGIPSPVRAKLSDIISQTQQDKEDLSTKIDEINDSIQVILNEKLETKVDKEEGKSLIDDEVKERFKVIENEEFLEAKVDAEEKVLEGITSDGKKQINLPTTVPSVTIKGAAETTSMENEEFLDLKVDRENHILEGITRDGEKVLPLPITGNPTINEMKQEIANVKEQAKRSYLEIEFDEATGDLNAIIGDNSTITDVTTDDDGNIYLEEDITTSSEPESMTTLASVDETKETAIFNK